MYFNGALIIYSIHFIQQGMNKVMYLFIHCFCLVRCIIENIVNIKNFITHELITVFVLLFAT